MQPPPELSSLHGGAPLGKYGSAAKQRLERAAEAMLESSKRRPAMPNAIHGSKHKVKHGGCAS